MTEAVLKIVQAAIVQGNADPAVVAANAARLGIPLEAIDGYSSAGSRIFMVGDAVIETWGSARVAAVSDVISGIHNFSNEVWHDYCLQRLHCTTPKPSF